MSHAFITYAPDDLDALLALHEGLRRAGIEHRYTAIGAAPDGSARLRDIEDAFALIVLVSGPSQRDDQVVLDVERAVARGMPILPILVDKSRLTGSMKRHVGPYLKRTSHDANGLEDFVRDVGDQYRQRCPVVAVMNLKGGVGKTTVSAQVFGAFQKETGGRVLLIDFDPQYNLTQFFFPMDTADRFAARDQSVISLFERSRLHYPGAPSPADDWAHLTTEPFEPAAARDLVHPILPATLPGRLDLVSGQFEISKYAFSTDQAALDAVRRQFLRAIDTLRAAYDLIVFDTNPNATFLTTCALTASDHVLAPMHADAFSLRGVKLLNWMLNDQVGTLDRPELDVMFNAVARNEQSDFEADARTGAHDAQVDFALSKRLLSAALPYSGHFRVQDTPDIDQKPHERLLVHHGRGGGLKATRDRLSALVLELQARYLTTVEADRPD